LDGTQDNNKNFSVRLPVLKGHLPFWGALAPQKNCYPQKRQESNRYACEYRLVQAE
jgi:hypothetical protein